MEIIDFHTHPFKDIKTNICNHRSYCFNPTPIKSMEYLKQMGINKICGSVILKDTTDNTGFEAVKEENDIMLELKAIYKDFYIPGFRVHPDFVEESLTEIERMHKLGINLIGEIIPQSHEYEKYTSKAFYEILDLAKNYNMIVSIHSMEPDAMDKLVADNKDLIIVAAHPGELDYYIRHLARMKKYENYYLDLSGTGLFRHAMLRRGIDECGEERFIFGTDYPVCNPAMFIGGIMFDLLLSDKEKEAIFSKNAKRLLKLS